MGSKLDALLLACTVFAAAAQDGGSGGTGAGAGAGTGASANARLVCVTGATGYVAGVLIDALLADPRGLRVRGTGSSRRATSGSSEKK